MTTINTKDISELRARTGAGIGDCKKALEEANGDMALAGEILRKKGIAKAEKRAGRDASQGLVVIETSADGKTAAMIELNSETDFVARNENFQALAKSIAEHALKNSPVGVTLEGFLAENMNGKSVDETIKLASGTIGESLGLKRVAKFTANAGAVGEYRHFNAQVGVIVELDGATGDEALGLARELALHIASMDPIAVASSDIPADLLDRERRIALDQVIQEGKPEAMHEKIVEGKVKKFAAERALLEQPFIKDESISIGKLVEKVGGAKVLRFSRFKVGESA